MADLPTPLTLAERQRIIDALAQKGAVQACPRCLTGTFAISDYFMAPQLVRHLEDAGQLFGTKRIHPMIGLTCGNCGYVIFHALAPLGVMDLFHKKEETK